VLHGLDKLLESHARLAIMALLVVQQRAGFQDLKTELELTDGNLASHATALEKAGYLRIHKGFVGKKVNTLYELTPEGRAAFEAHIAALEKLIAKG
jgi:DNA-binding MarR family transcriptional regulator